MKEVVIGVDIGGTYTKFGIVDRKGNCLFEKSICTNSNNGVEEYVRELSEALKKELSIYPDIELKGIGIGAPNGNHHKGTIEFAPNLKWKGVIHFVDLIKKYFDVQVVLTNDANAAAIGEMIFGGAKNMRDFIVITLGTGLGSGIVSNGELIYGHDGFAGEIGHTIVRHNGRQCGCGRQGCLETYVSASGIKRSVYKLLADSLNDSKLRGISFNELSADMITQAAKEGDRIAISAFEYTGSLLGQKLADSVAYTSPEAIFLLGGLAKAGDFILEPTRKHLELNLLNIYKNKIKVLLSGLTELNAAVMGASALAWKELEK